MEKKLDIQIKTANNVAGGKVTEALNKKRKPRQASVQKRAKIKSAGHTDELKRQLIIQKALYKIAAAASAVKDMQSFYKKLHGIVGKLMYARNFFIALYEPQTDLITWPYNVDTVDIQSQPPMKLSDFRGATGWVLRHGKTIAVVDGSWAGAISRGELQPVGTDSNGIAVPLRVGSKTIGVLMVQSYIEGIGYQRDDVRVLEFVAQHISTALTRARAIEETRQRNAELAVINSVQQGLAAELNFQSIIDLVGDKLREVMKTGELGIRWYEPDTNLIHYLYEYEHGERIEVPSAPPRGKAWEKLVLTRKPIIFNSTSEMLEAGNVALPGTDQSKASVFVPIIGNDRVLGSIITENYEKENAYTEADIRLLTTIASSMGIALENARLFDETQRLLKETEERNAELAIINSVQEGLAAQLDIQAIYDLIGDKIQNTFNVQTVTINSFDLEKNQRIYHYNIENGQHFPVGSRPMNSFDRFFIHSGKPYMVTKDLVEVTKARFPDVVPYQGDLPKSFLAAPLTRDQKVFGYISLQNLEAEEAFGDEDVRLLSTLASSMSVALENARLFEEVQKRNREVTDALEHQTATSEILSVIAGNPTDVGPVLKAVAEKAASLCNSYDAAIVRVEDDRYRIVAHWGPIPIPQGNVDPGVPVDTDSVTGHALLEGKTIHIHDVLSTGEGEYSRSKEFHEHSLQRTLLVTPLLREGRVIGAIILRRQEVDPFTDKQITLLKIFADQAAIAIENVRLFQETTRLLKETEQRAGELSAISRVSQALVAETELDNMIQLIGSQMREIFAADIVYVALLDKQTNLIHFPYQIGESFGTLNLGEGLTSKIIQTGEPLLINKDIKVRRKQLGTMLVGREALSYLGVPIKSGKGTIGVLSVQSTTEEGVFDDNDMRLLTTIAANAGAAIHTAQLHAETQRRAREMAILAEIGSDIAASRELEPVLERIASHAKDILRVRDIAIYLRDGDELYVPVALGTYTEELKAQTLKIGKGITGNVAQIGVAEMINYPASDPRVVHVAGTPEEDDAHEAMMVAPLSSRGEVIGALTVWRPHSAGLFIQPDLEFLISVARQTAIAIESARLYLETQLRAREMSALVEVGREISASLDAKTVLESIATHAKDLLNGDLSALFLPEVDGSTFRAITAVGDEAEELRNDTINLGEGILGNIAQNGVGEIVNDVNNDSRALTITGTKVNPDEHMIVVPLLANEELKGLMSVWRHGKGKEFIKAELEFLNGLSRQAVIAVQNAQLFAETTDTLEQQTATSEILQAIASSPTDIQPVLDVIAQNAARLSGSEDALIDIKDDETLRVVAHFGNIPMFPVGEGIPLNQDSVAGRAIVEGRTFQTLHKQPGEASEYPEGDKWAQKYGYRMTCSVPLLREGTAIGVITIRRFEPDKLNEKQLTLIETFASQAVIAIENVRLFNKTQHLLKVTEQRAAELAILNSVGESMTRTLDVKKVTYNVGDKIREIFNAEIVDILHYDPANRLIQLVYSYCDGRYYQDEPPWELGTGLTSKIILSHQPILLNSAQAMEDHGAAAYVTTPTDAQDPESYIGVPITVGDRIMGVVDVQSYKPNAFNEDNLRLLQTLSANMGVALENARLFTEIESQRQYLEAIISNSPVAIITADLNGKVVSWNPAAETLFGYTRVEAVGKDTNDLIALAEEIRAEALICSMQTREGKLFHSITRRNRKDGIMVEVDMAVVPVSVGKERMGIVGIYHDITELQRARQEAIAANEAKSSFLATMSHEIRTPMNAVIGMSGLLLDTKLDKEQRDYAETIRNSGDALLAIINDILDFSKIEAGKMDLEEQPFDLRECVESALDLVAARAVEKGIDLAYLIGDEVPGGIYGDVTRLRQILLNLLSNAVKFTEQGEVVLTVAGSKSGKGELLFAVRDTGIGIPEDRIGQLFESFSQVDSSTTRKFGGTGLGLAISKRLAELMGGSMSVESGGKNLGSIFSFAIPAKPAKVTGRKHRDLENVRPALEGKRVLIVDDNKTNRRILVLQTGKWGMQPRETKSARQALRWLRQGDPFDLAIFDLQMPEMDGVMLTREVRSLAGRQSLPIILLTSLGRREIGIDEIAISAYLAKPLKPSALFDVLAGIFTRPEIAVPKTDSAKPMLDPEMARQHPLRILLAEDNQVNQKLALRLLEQMGYRADVASNGLEAVESVKRQTYDVILMDVQMPEMDGLDATRLIRKQEMKQPYIIAMTANAMQGDREMCLAAGMEFYITKPIRVPELVAALKLAKKDGR